MTEKNYLNIVRASAWYDLIITSAFATPWTFIFVYGAMQSTASSLGLHGAMPDLGVTDILFANLLGTVVIVWSVVRLSAPLVRYGKFDAAGRAFFALWQIYAVYSGASTILLAFTFFEILFGVLQALPVHAKKTS